MVHGGSQTWMFIRTFGLSSMLSCWDVFRRS